ncbi:anti-sigma factor domain-containing protein [Nocardioides sp.]|uniref:anti-sigma factor n=1 Tax=Nocardioides sp. TaxID=35761 RepID=UPI0035168F1D
MSGDIHALSGAYTVDALDDLERVQFERHLAQCAACRLEVDSLREAAGLLTTLAEIAPPERLRASVLTSVTAVRPLPPNVEVLAERTRRTHRRFPALAAAAAALIALGAGSVVTVQALDDDRAPARELAGPDNSALLAKVESQPDAETIVSTLASGEKVRIVRSKSLNQAVLATDGLPGLPADRVYELWLIHDGAMVPAGTTDGAGGVHTLAGDAASATGAGITVEPVGGSGQPTGAPLATVYFNGS